MRSRWPIAAIYRLEFKSRKTIVILSCTARYCVDVRGQFSIYHITLRCIAMVVRGAVAAAACTILRECVPVLPFSATLRRDIWPCILQDRKLTTVRWGVCPGIGGVVSNGGAHTESSLRFCSTVGGVAARPARPRFWPYFMVASPPPADLTFAHTNPRLC